MGQHRDLPNLVLSVDAMQPIGLECLQHLLNSKYCRMTSPARSLAPRSISAAGCTYSGEMSHVTASTRPHHAHRGTSPTGDSDRADSLIHAMAALPADHPSRPRAREHELTLSAERPVVTTEAVPVERVRPGKETVTEQQTVGGEIRKEQIEFDGETGTRPTKRG